MASMILRICCFIFGVFISCFGTFAMYHWVIGSGVAREGVGGLLGVFMLLMLGGFVIFQALFPSVIYNKICELEKRSKC